jgi:hypothetical protein
MGGRRRRFLGAFNACQTVGKLRPRGFDVIVERSS